MLSVEPLSWKHHDFLKERWSLLYKNEDLFFSEYSFANNYLFRKTHNYQFIKGKHCFVRGEFSPDCYYYIPTDPFENLDQAFLSDILGQKGCLYPIPMNALKYFSELNFKYRNSDSDSDYVYVAEKLSTLKGRSLSSRRNLLHQLEENYSLESKEIGKDVIKDALSVLEEWQDQSKIAKEKTDYDSCKEALDFFERLDLCGRIVYANGKPVGFTIGERLSSTIAVIHFAKSLHEIKGVTPFLYKDFAANLDDTILWINMEQDLGISSLRQAKKAYDPECRLVKWRIYNI